MRTAGAAGSPQAQLQLGYLYTNGIGTAQDPERALAAYRAAARSGLTQAMQRLGHLLVAGASTQQR